jgi:hypothetical protein
MRFDDIDFRKSEDQILKEFRKQKEEQDGLKTKIKNVEKSGLLKEDLWQNDEYGNIVSNTQKDEIILDYITSFKKALPKDTKFVYDFEKEKWKPQINKKGLYFDECLDDHWAKKNLKDITEAPKVKKKRAKK